MPKNKPKTNLEKGYCECGQYLVKYFNTCGQLMKDQNATIRAMECPAKDCNATYTLQVGDDKVNCKVILIRGREEGHATI